MNGMTRPCGMNNDNRKIRTIIYANRKYPNDSRMTMICHSYNYNNNNNGNFMENHVGMNLFKMVNGFNGNNHNMVNDNSNLCSLIKGCAEFEISNSVSKNCKAKITTLEIN